MPQRLWASGRGDIIEVDLGPAFVGGGVGRSDVPRWRSGRRVRLATTPLLKGIQVVVEGVRLRVIEIGIDLGIAWVPLGDRLRVPR